MAGGKGERFWPRSRESMPKQLQKVYSNKTLLRETIDRALTITDISRIFIGTNAELKKSILKTEPKFPSKNFIIEPEGKNTAPIIALASLFFRKRFGNPVQVVLSADAFISPIKEFTKNIKDAIHLAENNLVLLGIRPNRPETGYGYISSGKMNPSGGIKVLGFYEKPDHKTALKYVKRKNFFWNPGIFVWKTDLIISEFEKFAPYIINPLAKSYPYKSKEELKNIFKRLPSEPVDIAIMEKSSSIEMVKASFTWDDVGSWISLERVLKGDAKENYHIGKQSFHFKSSGNISSIKKDLVVFLGVEDLIVVEEDDLIFLASKKGFGDIKNLLSEFRKNKSLQKYLK
ncbi:MAG: mannose-1-phosphate guanylyltransferase [Leptospiraceae bacterium]|nr:mannose-1-phosphate guanylyltransferase [Leptospiraceae bacterium]